MLSFSLIQHLTQHEPHATCHQNVCILLLPEVCVQSVLTSTRIAFTVCNEICNINHYYLSCDLDVDIEIEEQIYHCLI